ncbi:MAG: RNA polymerase sigma factor [Thermomicrobiales bacterium]
MRTEDLDDAALIARSQHHDREAYAALVRRYQDVAFRTALVILRNAADAEDAAQSAFIKAWLALDRFRHGAPFRPWLLRIVANEAKNLRLARYRQASHHDPDPDALVAFADAGPGPEPIAVSNEEGARLLAHIATLREEDRMVIACRYLLDLSEAETAAVLDCPRGTVKSRLSRALDRLRTQIGKEAWS